MAVQPQTPHIEHIANGTTTGFNLGFDCDDQDHLIVKVDDVEPSVGSWSLTGSAVVFGAAPTSGNKITIQRNTPFERKRDYQSYDNSFRPPAVNKDFDWIWLKLQELGVADWILGNRIAALKNYVDLKDDELRSYLMEEIRKQGVALDQLDEYYNYLMQRLAQIAVDKGWDASFVTTASGQNQQEINDFGGAKWHAKSGGYELGATVKLDSGDTVQSTKPANTVNPNVDTTGWTDSKEKDGYVNIFDFCKCDGTDESVKALLAVNRANSQRVPLNIPSNAELLINGSTTLEPIYGIFGGGRIRKGLYGWLSGSPAILVNNPNQFVDNIRFVKSDTAWVDLESVTVTNNTDRVGWIEVTKSAKNFKITNNIFRGGRFCNWIYGGTNGLVFANDSDATEEAFIYFGTTNVYTKPPEVIDVVDGVVVANNRVRNVSNASLGGSTGDGIKTTMRCKNIAIIGNNIQGCRGDAVDLFASGESILVSNNILANNTVKGVDIKSVAETDPVWPKDTVKQQQIIVTGNHIFNNGQFGIAVAFNTGVFNMVNISDNNIYKNGYGGIAQQGNNAIITNNIVYANATTPGVLSYASGIRIEGDVPTDTYSSNIKCTGNICVNNGNSTDTNNCGIVVFGGRVEDCDIHSNILINSDSPGLENSGKQNYGFFCGGGKRISFLHNTAKGNITRDVGWSLDSDLIGTIRTVNLGTVSDTVSYPLGSAKKNWGVHSIEVQSKAYAANSTNYFTLSIRKIDSAGVRTAIDNFLATSTESLDLYPIRKVIPANNNEMDAVPFLLSTVTGTPTPLNQLTISLNIIDW